MRFASRLLLPTAPPKVVVPPVFAVSPCAPPEAAFNLAVEQVREAAAVLVRSLVTTAPARDREVVRIKAMEESRKRFGLRE